MKTSPSIVSLTPKIKLKANQASAKKKILHMNTLLTPNCNNIFQARNTRTTEILNIFAFNLSKILKQYCSQSKLHSLVHSN